VTTSPEQAVHEWPCANCGTPRQGEYCHLCGQRAIAGDELTVAHTLRHAADDTFHLESKTLRSIGLLFRPGFLTAEYLDGRRARYTAPVKLYLACAAIFFLCAPIAGFTLEQLLAADSGGALERLVTGEMTRQGLERAHFAERFDLRFQTVYTFLLFASMLGNAAMLALLFRRQKRPLGAHVIFELHYVSFLMLLSIVLGFVLRGLTHAPLASVVATLAVLSPYLFMALRRVYREPRGPTLWKTAALLVFALLFDNLMNFVSLVVTLKLV
jgi:hypothetical protein